MMVYHFRVIYIDHKEGYDKRLTEDTQTTVDGTQTEVSRMWSLHPIPVSLSVPLFIVFICSTNVQHQYRYRFWSFYDSVS